MFSGKWKEELMTIPNLLSLLRISLIPIYLTVYLHATQGKQYLLAGFILTVSCITDLADGIIARKFHQITNIGKVLDPLADKLTQLVLILSLASRFPLLYPVLVLFLTKESFQFCALLFFAQKGKVLPGALPAGKLCTTVLFVSLILLVLFPQMHPYLVIFLTIADTGFLLYSFDRYLAAYFGSHKELRDFNPDE